jgi:hypothetical protein
MPSYCCPWNADIRQIQRRKRLNNMEQVKGQVVYVFRTEDSKELATEAKKKFGLFGMSKQFGG